MKMPAAEETRIRQRYRTLILLGKARISLEAARGLIGQDCAYHLYARRLPKRSRGKR